MEKNEIERMRLMEQASAMATYLRELQEHRIYQNRINGAVEGLHPIAMHKWSEWNITKETNHDTRRSS